MRKSPAPIQLRLRLRIDLGDGRRLGPGKIDLLEAVGSTGSISGAGRTLGMSYRRAWLLINAVNAMFDEPVVTGFAGGAQGGGAVLTPLGSKLVAVYRRIEAQAQGSTAKELAPLLARLKPPDEGADH